MKKMMMAALFAAIATAAFGWLPENCMIRDRLCGEDASDRLCGKFDISCTERLFDIMRTNTAEIVRIENALYPAPKYDRIMPMEGETKHLRKGLDAAFAQLFDDFRSFIWLQRQYKRHLERLSDNTVSNGIERRDWTWEEIRLGETRGLTERYSIFVGEITTSLGQPARRINAVDVDKYMSDVRIPSCPYVLLRNSTMCCCLFRWHQCRSTSPGASCCLRFHHWRKARHTQPCRKLRLRTFLCMMPCDWLWIVQRPDITSEARTASWLSFRRAWFAKMAESFMCCSPANGQGRKRAANARKMSTQQTKGTETMKPFARMILVSFLALANVPVR